MAENRSALLRRDGLSAAKEVLYELDKYLSNRLHSFAVPTVDVAMHDLIEEFIFQEPPGSPSTGKKFSSLQELQLLEIIGSYFHEQSKDALRQLVFSSLFKPRGNMADPARLSLLSRLLSMAVAVARAPVLDCTAVWMQRTPVPFCTELVQSLVEDYCSLVPDVITTLQQAVTTSPRFCCQLITAITTLYDLSSGAFTPPPNLLNVVVTWVCEKPQLTLHNFLNSPIPASSPQGFLDLTPLAGLITWCVLSPLVTRVGSKVDTAHPDRFTDAHGSSTVIMNDQKSEKLKQEGEGAEDDQTLVYSRLHLGVLQVLQLLYSHMAEKKLLGRLALISLDQVSTLVSELKRHGQEFNPLCPTPRLQLSLERFAQAMQLSMAMGALLCSRDDLRKVCSGLPPSSLLQLVLKGPAQPAPEPFPYYPHIQTTPPSYSAAQSSSNYASFRNLQ